MLVWGHVVPSRYNLLINLKYIQGKQLQEVCLCQQRETQEKSFGPPL